MAIYILTPGPDEFELHKLFSHFGRQVVCFSCLWAPPTDGSHKLETNGDEMETRGKRKGERGKGKGEGKTVCQTNKQIKTHT